MLELPVEPQGSLAALIPLTVTHILEHLYCPRFTYFEYVLAIPQRQERRPLVLKGRQVHEERRKINAQYLRKKLGVVERRFDVSMASRTLGIRGTVDELLALADGTMAPFDYKYAEYPGHVYHNQKVQSALYALLIRQHFGVPVTKGFLCYTRSNHRVITVEHSAQDYEQAIAVIEEVLSVIQTGVFPKGTEWTSRCRDCCYRNICMR